MKCVILDNLRSAHNVGNIYRSAYSFGFDCIIHVGVTPQPDNPNFLSSSRGSEKYLKRIVFEGMNEAVSYARSKNLAVYSLEMNVRAQRLREASIEGDFAVILGNEALGVSQMALEQSDKIISIETDGRKDSLNVAVAFGIFAYDAFMKLKSID